MGCAGAKYVRLYASSETPYLYVDRLANKSKGGAYSTRSQGNISLVDVEAPDMEKFPLFSQACFTETVLMPGDALYIFAKCWHFVRSLTTKTSVNFWF